MQNPLARVGEAPLQIMLKIQAGRRALKCLWKAEQNIYVRLCSLSLEKGELLVSQHDWGFFTCSLLISFMPFFFFLPSLDLLGNMVHMFIILPVKATPAFTSHTSTLQCFPSVQRFARRNFKPFHNFQRWQLDHCLPAASCSENKLPFPLLSLIPIPRNFRMLCVILQSSVPPG